MNLRVSEEGRLGVDGSQHGERGSVFEGTSPGLPTEAPMSASRPSPQSAPQEASSEAS